MRTVLLTTDSREHLRDYSNPNPGFGTAPAALLEGFAQLPEVEIHVVSCVQRPVVSPEKIAPNIFYHSLLVPKLGWLRTGYQGCIRAVRRKLKEIQPDLVHGQGMERDCSISAVFSGFPNVLTIHGNMRLIARLHGAKPFTYGWLAAKLEGFTIPRADGVVCITNYTREAVQSLAKKTWVIPNAVDASFFEVQPSLVPDAPPIGLCVGTICLRKNQNDFIRALDPLAREKRFKIIFLGQVENNAYSGEFLRLVQERPWCEHAGFADRDRLREHFKAATVLALPTLEDNCPMVVLEAMAAGVPVLASRVGGVPDLFEDEKTGLFCNPLDAASMRDGLARLLAGGEFPRQMAAAAKVRAQERFRPVVIARRHMEIYHEVLSARS